MVTEPGMVLVHNPPPFPERGNAPPCYALMESSHVMSCHVTQADISIATFKQRRQAASELAMSARLSALLVLHCIAILIVIVCVCVCVCGAGAGGGGVILK